MASPKIAGKIPKGYHPKLQAYNDEQDKIHRSGKLDNFFYNQELLRKTEEEAIKSEGSKFNKRNLKEIALGLEETYASTKTCESLGKLDKLKCLKNLALNLKCFSSINIRNSTSIIDLAINSKSLEALSLAIYVRSGLEYRTLIDHLSKLKTVKSLSNLNLTLAIKGKNFNLGSEQEKAELDGLIKESINTLNNTTIKELKLNIVKTAFDKSFLKEIVLSLRHTLTNTSFKKLTFNDLIIRAPYPNNKKQAMLEG